MIPAALSTLFTLGSAIKTATDAIKTVDNVVDTVDKLTSDKSDADEYALRLLMNTVIKIREARFEAERSLEQFRQTKKYILSGSMKRFVEQFSRVKPVEFQYRDLSAGEFVQPSDELDAMLDGKISRGEARKFEEEGRQICSYLDTIKARADQTNNRLTTLDRKLSDAVDEMEFLLERHGADGSKLPNDVMEQLYHALQIAKKINEIINTPLLAE